MITDMWGALPNLHPALVHAPIVLLPLAGIIDAVAFARRDDRSLNVVAWVLWWLGAAAATATYLAGRVAADGLVDIQPETWVAVGTHADRAWWVLVVAWMGVACRSFGGTSWRGALTARVVALAASVALFPLLVLTADAGGALVFEHAVSVTRAPVKPCPVCEEDAGASLSVDGAETVFVAGEASAAFTQFEDPKSGATVAVHGTRTLEMAGSWADVQVNAWLDTSDFEGTVSLLHHVVDDRADAFVVAAGSAALVRANGEELDRSEVECPNTFALAVNVTGSHLKGLLNGAVVAHGHGPVSPPGAVGLRLDGQGTIQLTRFEVIALASEEH